MTQLKNTLTVLFIFTVFIANAQINHTDNNDVFLSNGNINIDFDGDNTSDFTFTDSAVFGDMLPSVEFDVQASFVNRGAGYTELIKGLSEGALIDSTNDFENGTTDRYGYIVDPSENTTFPSGDTFIGATFLLSGNVHYGWIKVNWDGSDFVVKEFAYNETANASINAGATSTANVNSSQNLSNIKVYPNPFVNEINIDTDKALKISITDLTGKNVYNDISNSQNLNLNSLKAGVYFLKIQYENQLKVQTIIKK